MLTTRCPHCNTVFRIRPEQLSVRGGRVRCGHCQQPFSALANLEDMEDDDEDISSPPRPASPPPRPASPAAAPAAARPSVPSPAPAPAQKPPLAQPAAVTPPPARPASPPPAPPAPPPKPAPQSAGSNPDELFRATLLPPTPTANQAGKPAAPTPASRPAPTPAPKPNLATMPVPLTGRAPDEGVMVTSWDQFALPVDIEDLDDDEPPAKPLDPRPEPKLGKPSAAPASGTQDPDFSMNIVMDGSNLPPNTPIDPDFDDQPAPPKEPYQSEVAKQLGIPAYDPTADDRIMDQTLLLEEPVDLARHMRADKDNGPDSLFDEHERQKLSSTKGVEDRRRKKGRKGEFAMWSAGAAFMLLLTVAMLAFIFRTDLARTAPGLRPKLEAACVSLGCAVPYPRDKDQIEVAGNNFSAENANDPNRYRLVVTLRNKGAYALTWPHIELTVTDRFDIAVARRVLTPAEWLPPGYTNQPAFDGNSEVTANLPLTLNNVQAAGYRVYVFYP